MTKLFDTIAPRYVDRPGGYTRLLRLGYRRGDSAEVAEVELVGSEFDPNKAEKADKADAAPDKPKKKSMGGRIREALSGGRKKADEDRAPRRRPARPPRDRARSHDAEESRRARSTSSK